MCMFVCVSGIYFNQRHGNARASETTIPTCNRWLSFAREALSEKGLAPTLVQLEQGNLRLQSLTQDIFAPLQATCRPYYRDACYVTKSRT